MTFTSRFLPVVRVFVILAFILLGIVSVACSDPSESTIESVSDITVEVDDAQTIVNGREAEAEYGYMTIPEGKEVIVAGSPFEVKTDNCGSSVSANESFSRSREFSTELETGISSTLGGELGVSTVVAEARVHSSIEAHLNVSIGKTDTVGVDKPIETPADSISVVTLQWEELWDIGHVQIIDNNNVVKSKVPFRLLSTIRLSQKSVNEIPCSTPTVELTSTPTEEVEITHTPSSTSTPLATEVSETPTPSLTPQLTQNPTLELTATPELEETPSGVADIQPNQMSELDIPIRTPWQDINAKIISIESGSDQEMQWLIDFENARDGDVTFSVDVSASYVVDENGTRYAMKGEDIGYTVQAGVRVQQEFRFDAAEAGASLFELHLFARRSSYVTYERPAAIVNVTINSSPVPEVEEPMLSVPLRTPWQDINAKVTGIESNAGVEMRWTIDFRNARNDDVTFSVDVSESYVVDENGTRYAMKGEDIGYTIQAGVRVQQEIRFAAPELGTTIFELYLFPRRTSYVTYEQPAAVVQLVE